MTWRIRGRSFEGGGALGFQLYLRGSLTDGPSVDSFYSSFSIRVIDIVLFLVLYVFTRDRSFNAACIAHGHRLYYTRAGWWKLVGMICENRVAVKNLRTQL